MAVELKGVAERLDREASPEDINTIRGDEEDESRGVKASVTRTVLILLTSKVSRNVSRSLSPSSGASFSEVGQPSSDKQMPALLTRTSSRPNCEETAETALEIESSEAIL